MLYYSRLMQSALRRYRPILIALAVVGVIATLVYGLCHLIVLQTGAIVPEEATGKIHLYVTTGSRGRLIVHYVTHAFLLTSTISGWIAAILLGVPLAIGTLLVLADTLRLFIPGRYEPANRELARYRKAAGDGVTEEGLRYVAKWRDFNRRRALPLLLILALLLVPVLGLQRELSASWMWIWIAALAAALIGQRLFRCPRCRERFSGKRNTRFAPPFCTSCGLPEGSPPTTAAHPDFAEWKRWN